jgi:hypothetical protein
MAAPPGMKTTIGRRGDRQSSVLEPSATERRATEVMHVSRVGLGSFRRRGDATGIMCHRCRMPRQGSCRYPGVRERDTYCTAATPPRVQSAMARSTVGKMFGEVAPMSLPTSGGKAAPPDSAAKRTKEAAPRT